MVKRYFCLLIILIFIISGIHFGFAQSLSVTPHTLSTNPDISEITSGYFTENKGQWDSNILFMGNTSFGKIAFTKDSVNYQLINQTNSSDKNKSASVETIDLTFVNGLNPTVKGDMELPHYNNYFLGNDPENWISNCRNYEKVYFENIWEGIDLAYFYSKQGLKYEYYVKPQADIDNLKIKVKGAQIYNYRSRLELKTSIGSIFDDKLMVYDQKSLNIIDSDFYLKDNIISFIIEEADLRNTIVIDPMIYSTLLGDGIKIQYNSKCSLAVDNNRNTYIAGATNSANFPSTKGSYQGKLKGGNAIGDAFVAKLNSNGTTLSYCTYLGGSSEDIINSITVDSQGSAFIAGYTDSSDFPVSKNAFQKSINNNIVAFTAKLNSTGTALIYSTYLGGSKDDNFANSIAIDSLGNAYVAGVTSSSDFPVTKGAFQTINKGDTFAFVTKLNSTGTSLIYSTYLSGSYEDTANAIAVDSKFNAYITGITKSSNFPTTKYAFQTRNNGSTYAFVTKLNSTGTSLIYSTYLGGSNDDFANAIAIDSKGNAYIAGYTISNDFPATGNSVQIRNKGNRDGFITKINSEGNSIIYSTFLGGANEDIVNAIAVDSQGTAYIAGYTVSSDFPITKGSFQDSYIGNYSAGDAFVTKLSATGSSIINSTYLGGSSEDSAKSISIDSNSNAYIAGYTGSFDFPVTKGAYQTNYRGRDLNAYVVKLNLYTPNAKPSNPKIPEKPEIQTPKNPGTPAKPQTNKPSTPTVAVRSISGYITFLQGLSSGNKTYNPIKNVRMLLIPINYTETGNSIFRSNFNFGSYDKSLTKGLSTPIYYLETVSDSKGSYSFKIDESVKEFRIIGLFEDKYVLIDYNPYEIIKQPKTDISDNDFINLYNRRHIFFVYENYKVNEADFNITIDDDSNSIKYPSDFTGSKTSKNIPKYSITNIPLLWDSIHSMLDEFNGFTFGSKSINLIENLKKNNSLPIKVVTYFENKTSFIKNNIPINNRMKSIIAISDEHMENKADLLFAIWHESTHYIQNCSWGIPAYSSKQDSSHQGYSNSDTRDSLYEGFSNFIPLYMWNKNKEKYTTLSPYIKSGFDWYVSSDIENASLRAETGIYYYNNIYDLKIPIIDRSDLTVGNNALRNKELIPLTMIYSYEEYAVSALILDLIDNTTWYSSKSDDDNFSLKPTSRESLGNLIQILSTDIKDIFSLYLTLSTHNVKEKLRLDYIFTSHGFFNDCSDRLKIFNGLHESNEQIGLTYRPSFALMYMDKNNQAQFRQIKIENIRKLQDKSNLGKIKVILKDIKGLELKEGKLIIKIINEKQKYEFTYNKKVKNQEIVPINIIPMSGDHLDIYFEGNSIKTFSITENEYLQSIVDDKPYITEQIFKVMPKTAVNKEPQKKTDSVIPVAQNNQKITIYLRIGDKEALVNDQKITLDIAPLIKNRHTFVPLRFIGESFNAKVNWIKVGSTGTITFDYQKDEFTSINIILHPKSYIANVKTISEGKTDNKEIILESAPYLALPENRIVVPLKFITDVFGATTQWNPENKSITISYDTIPTLKLKRNFFYNLITAFKTFWNFFISLFR